MFHAGLRGGELEQFQKPDERLLLAASFLSRLTATLVMGILIGSSKWQVIRQAAD
jgi:hypothetical protein